ncbi:MAG: hypothetical protein EA369_08325 [Bradymonadales bacterium]|nr:MAG: hypothetical protein EA369_08325 [Bradymonadales bacterium]
MAHSPERLFISRAYPGSGDESARLADQVLRLLRLMRLRTELQNQKSKERLLASSALNLSSSSRLRSRRGPNESFASVPWGGASIPKSLQYLERMIGKQGQLEDNRFRGNL